MKATALAFQPQLFEPCPVQTAVESMAVAGVEARGAIFTRREVVDFILDLAGYTVDRPLHERRLLEPSFGGGDFLLPAVDRLLTAYEQSGGVNAARDLRCAIRAVELHRGSYVKTAAALAALLEDHGLTPAAAESLCEAWLLQGDFLLAELPGCFDYVVGNPPYVRQELIADALLQEYKRRYTTIFDRADLYIPFIERSLGCSHPKVCWVSSARTAG